MKDIVVLFSSNEAKTGIRVLAEIDRLFGRIATSSDSRSAWMVVKDKTQRVILNHQKWFKQEIEKKPCREVIYSIAEKICRKEVIAGNRVSLGELSNEGKTFFTIYLSIVRLMAVQSKQITIDAMLDLMEELELEIKGAGFSRPRKKGGSEGERIFLLICAGLLFFALADFPIGYYILLRIAVTVGGVIVIVKEVEQNGDFNFWVISFGLSVILFNPFFPVYLHDRSAWMPIDIVCGGLFFVKAITWKAKQRHG